jgi:glycerol uptake facilitator protein
MEIFISELVGTFLLILLGNGVVANVVLKDTKGHGGGWIVITMGWAFAVFIGVTVAAKSGAHLNPAVTVAMLMKGNIAFSEVLIYIFGQILGAFVGACAVYFTYQKHYDVTDDTGLKLATFSTSPAKNSPIHNLFAEIIGTFVLIFAILNIPQATNDLGGLNPLPVALIVLSIGLSLGGTTGYAINPARDFGPRLAHAFLPIKSKGSSEWHYAWIPIVGPIIGAIVAVLIHTAL